MVPLSPLWIFLLLLGVHWVADFVLQTDWQARNKSTHNRALLAHIVVYTACLGAVSAWMFGVGWPWGAFVLVNAVLHCGTDYVTSRISSRFYAKQEWHYFFVVIGFDQFLHQAALAGTVWWALGATQ